MNTKPQPKSFDVVHPSLKNETRVADCDYGLICETCNFMQENRTFLSVDFYMMNFCSWECLIDYKDYLQWNFEMGRRGIYTDHYKWLRSNSGTKFFEMYRRK